MYADNSKKYTKKVTELVNRFATAGGHKVGIRNQVTFYRRQQEVGN